MKELKGIYASAKIYAEDVEDYAVAQLQMLCDHEMSEGSRIRVMPDVHPGKVGTIGLTMTIKEKLIPYLLGGDIGCGLTCYAIKAKKVDGNQLDKVIREAVPAGFAIRNKIHRYFEEADLQRLRCFSHISGEKAALSLGTLGGGNHFLEVDQDMEGRLYLAVHSGSRHLGTEVTEYYQNMAYQSCRERGLSHPISYLEGENLSDYLHDLQIVQEYASLNRKAILDEICKGMKWKMTDRMETVHNYVECISDGRKILRKGAVSAKKDETLLIPVNMKEGMLLCRGKGNADWNESAPHGAGRILRLDQVKNLHTVSEFKKEMQGIYCSCISRETLDEAPFVYRGLEVIRSGITDTAEIQGILRPVYCYKAGSQK